VKRSTGWPGWLALAVVVAVALTVAVARQGGARTNQERADAVAKTLKCPVCRSESVYDSRAEASQNIKEEIARQVAAGRTDDEVRAYVEARFPGTSLLPASGGIEGLVWMLPVVAFVLAAAGVVAAFVRWRRAAGVEPTDEDRALVATARRRP
jgi:cytochrome c-type biogenesis protein CcmH